MGVANGRGYQEVGVVSGWNLWVWLVSVVLRRYIIHMKRLLLTRYQFGAIPIPYNP